MNKISVTGAICRAILAFIDPNNTPKIAYDRDDLTQPLIEKITNAVGDRDGSQSVSIWFNEGEDELMRQFDGVCGNIGGVFTDIAKMGEALRKGATNEH